MPLRWSLVAFLALALVPAAQADPRVPDLGGRDLAVAGTCGPIESADVSFVTVGQPGFYRIDGQPAVLDDAALLAALKQRAQGGPRHTVWVLAAATEPFLGVVKVRLLCQQAGLFRVGIQVQAEQGGVIQGFPLFVPARVEGAAGAAGGKGRRLRVRLDRTEGPEESNPRRLYAAARRAAEAWPPVVADVSLDANLAVQHVITCLDMLYRGGVAGVRLGFREPRVGRRSVAGPNAGALEVPTLLLAEVEERAIPNSEPDQMPGPIAPRKGHWGDEGANQPDALALVLEPLPDAARAPARGPAAPEILPSYAGRREGAPSSAVVAADRAATGWSAALGKALKQALARVWTLPPLFVKRMRDPQALARHVNPTIDLFPGTQKVVPSTLRLDVFLVRGVAIVGKVETAVNLSGSAMSFIWARWVTEQFPTDITLPPVQADPFAAGVPGHVRVWMEASFASVYRQGAAGLLRAPEGEVLAQLPPVAHAGAQRLLASRESDLDLLARWLTATEYDRLLLIPRSGSAAVHADGRVTGILQFGLESEEGELRLTSLSGRQAR
jgi:hypothetical protein